MDERTLDVAASKEVEEGYRSGVSIYDLADWFSVSEELILKVLIQRGVIKRESLS